MSLSRITTRLTRTVLTQCYRYSPSVSGRPHKLVSSFSDHLLEPHHKVIPGHVSFLHQSALKSSGLRWLGFSSSASPDSSEKEVTHSGNEQENKADVEAAATVDSPNQNEESVPNAKTESDSDADLGSDLSKEDLVKLVAEKEKLLGVKQEELETLKDKVLRALAEMENVKDRTRRESENTRKFAIQNFAKSLLDVADNLNRASSAAKESFSKVDASKDTAGAVRQLKVLLEGVEMTEKQLAEVFKKFGLEKYDPVDEIFDPNRHNAVFQVPDASKPEGQVAVVLKAGYMLHDRVVRPAEVGVTVAVNNEEAEK